MAEQYIVKAVKFKCVDESGIDWTGSDEPYWIFTNTTDGSDSGDRETFSSREFGDVDTGNVRYFNMSNGAGKNVIWPKKGTTQGAAGPIGLSIQLWESDQGDKYNIEKITKAAFDGVGLLPGVGTLISKTPDLIKNQIISLASDDIMGSLSLVFNKTTLQRRLRHEGESFQQKFRFSASGELPFGIGGSPDYDLTLEVVRVEDETSPIQLLTPAFRPILTDIMTHR